jgi:hypothetical protein
VACNMLRECAVANSDLLTDDGQNVCVATENNARLPFPDRYPSRSRNLRPVF